MDSTEWQEIKRLFLTANDLPEQERVDYLSGCSEDVRIKVEKLLKADKDAKNFIVDPAVIDVGLVEEIEHDPLINGNIDGYKIIREIGHGGMGTVYLARCGDGSFDKTVAIKLVKRGMDTNAVLKRFLVERSILAHLEHPNIAGLIDGGTTSDGLPYFVMEYVDGVPISKYCDSRGSSIIERLELFQKVCAAVSYAHANLVVHRDVKPSNILVTQNGTPKLLDFGIAKLLHPDRSLESAEATATMFRILTPEYASPEQIRGLAVTTATDVYSLGVVLYELLTGERPHRIEGRLPDEVVREILTAEAVKPSSVVSGQWPVIGKRTKTDRNSADENKESGTYGVRSIRNPQSAFRDLKGDLDNIVLKAIRKEPERRYASVQEFSEDIRRHLAGLPVTAVADTKVYRLKKFATRHRAGVVAGCLIVLTLITATAMTGWQAVVARRERDRAAERFDQVRKLANTVLFDYHDGIANLPGSTPLREKMVKDALEYLDNLATEAGQDSSLQMELAMAYQKTGDIQGGLNKSNLGQRQNAAESYAKALVIIESLVDAEPDNLDFRRKLAASYTKRGDILWVEADIIGATESYKKALEVNSQLLDESTDLDLQLDLAGSRMNFGYMLAAQGRGDEGLENLRQAISQLEELAIADPKNIEIRRALENSYDKVGDVWISLTQNHAEALRSYQKAKEISESLFAADPLDTRLRRAVAVTYLHVGEAYAKLGDNKLALDNSRRSLAIFTDMLSVDQQNDELRQAAATVQAFVCGLLIETGNPGEAVRLLDQSLVTLESSFAASPNDELAHFRLANVQAALGTAHAALASAKGIPAGKRLHEWRQARSWFEKSMEIYKPFRAAGKTTGDDDAKVDVAAQGIKRCDAEIERLTQ